jgi:hypothetical protein
MKTSVEWLVSEVAKNGLSMKHQQYLEIIEKALEMEKDQIVKAVDCIYLDKNGNQFTGEQYYTETFKQ